MIPSGHRFLNNLDGIISVEFLGSRDQASDGLAALLNLMVPIRLSNNSIDNRVEYGSAV